MTIHRLEITLNDELWDRLNAARGHEPRASFVKRALESSLDRLDRLQGRVGVGQGEPPSEPVANVLGSPVRKSRKTPSLKDTWGR